MFGRGHGEMLYGIHPYNVIRPLNVAAQAIGMTCADLVKAAGTGKSIVQVATEKNVQPQVVIDALVKAHQDAWAADVKEGLITQAQADGKAVRLVERVTQMISQPHLGHIGMMMRGRMGRMHGMMGDGMHGRGRGRPGMGEMPGRRGGPGMRGNPGNPGNPNNPNHSDHSNDPKATSTPVPSATPQS
jgi:hypothetical protein